MKRILSFLCLLSLLGCNSHQSQTMALGPLSQMNEFTVVIYAPSDADIDRVVESFKKIGEVSIGGSVFTSTDPSPSLLFFLSPYDISGTLKVFGEVAVQPNQFKTNSCIWTKEYRSKATSYPLETENGIRFEKIERPIEEMDVQALIDRMVAEFMDQYKHDNPDPVTLKFKCLRL